MDDEETPFNLIRIYLSLNKAWSITARGKVRFWLLQVPYEERDRFVKAIILKESRLALITLPEPDPSLFLNLVHLCRMQNINPETLLDQTETELSLNYLIDIQEAIQPDVNFLPYYYNRFLPRLVGVYNYLQSSNEVKTFRFRSPKRKSRSRKKSRSRHVH